MKHLLLVTPVGVHGGAEEVLLTLAQGLPEHGYRASLACMRPGPLVERASRLGIECHAWKPHRYRDIGSVIGGVRWLSDLIRRQGISLVHGSHTAHLYSGFAAVACRVPEAWHLFDFPHRVDIADRIGLRIPTDFAIFATERVREGYPGLARRASGVIAPVTIRPDLLPSLAFTPGVRAKLRAEGSPLVLTVARLQEHKGHRFLIDAIPAILRQFPDAVFAVVGKASGAEQEAYRDELIAQAERLGVRGSLRLLGYVDDADLRGLYREASLLVHPALSEGFGLTLLDAMALGLPVVAARADGPASILQDGKTGVLVPAASAAALSEGVLGLLAQPERAERLRQAALLDVARFDARRMVFETSQVYDRMLGERR